MHTTQDLPEIVADALSDLARCFERRDVAAAAACFTAEGAVYGDDVGEQAHGTAELRPFLAELFEEPFTIGWDLGRDLSGTWARRHGDVVWFVADAHVVLSSDEGWADRSPFRVSGILREQGGRWLFELFNGTQPAVRPEALLTV